jgi:enamine deaminase RidA (YjgF/YER057c/UK114 family)
MAKTKRHNPASVWTVPEGFRSIYSHAVETAPGGRQLFISGQFGIAPDGTLSAEFDAQLEQAMSNIEALLASARMSKTDIVKTNYYLTRSGDLPALGATRRRRWAKNEAEAVTVIVVAGLARPDCLVEVEAVAARWDG